MHRHSILKRRAVRLLASVAFFWGTPPLLPAFAQQALPSGGTVTSGAATIATGGTSVLVTQSSPTAIVNWNSFSVGQGNAVRFENGAGATLNRVTGFSRSQIDGALSASGSVYLVNPSGITVGPTGTINTGGAFIASTHDVSDAAFHAGGALTFKGGSTASVVNYGSIGSLGGDVALIARKVENAGTITAPNGTVALAAGYEVLMRDAALSDGKFVVKVGGADTEAKTSGVIKAAEVELKANGGNVYALAGNTNSLTKATGVATRGGRVFLTAGDGGKVTVSQRVVARAASSGGKAKGGEIRLSGGTAKVSGKLDASGKGAKGGTVVVTARDITLAAGAKLDASGTEGGTVLVGGDFQGGTGAVRYLAETLATAQTVTVADGASIRADGTAGAGGKVVVWSDQRTSFAGSISARGAGSASGGDAEVSGKAWLDYRGTADLRSDSGAFGTLLLDPYNITISSAASSGTSGFDANGNDSVLNVATLTNALAMANVTVTTGSAGTQAGNITVAAPIAWSAPSFLTLQAAGSILINADITASSAAGGGVALNFGTDYAFGNGARLDLTGAGTGLSINGDSYTLIRSMAELDAIDTTGPGGRYALAINLDAAGTSYGQAVVGGFTGTFTGLGHTISNFSISSSSDNTGLFGTITGATVRDIGLVGGLVVGGNRTGSLVGEANGTTVIRNVYSTVSVLGERETGGLVGFLDGGSISNAYATGNVSGSRSKIGGLVGSASNATIVRAYATGAVSSDLDGGVGGLVGYVLDTTFDNVYTSGAVTSSVGGSAGGLVGYSIGAIISNAYATGAVTGQGRGVGGLVGYDWAGTRISYAYATGAVTGPREVGGIVGMGAADLTRVFWDSVTTGQRWAVGGLSPQDDSRDISGGGELRAGAYNGFDFTNTWYIINGSTRPILRSEYSTYITNAHQLQLMAMDLGASYKLANDIDLSVVRQASQIWNTAPGLFNTLTAGFSPIGSSGAAFTGRFDGAGHVVSNLAVIVPGTSNVGLFGRTQGATIRNVGLEGGSVSGAGNVGSLVGSASASTIANVYATTAVSGGTAGGLVGQADQGTSILNAYATGAVQGTAASGGLVGVLDGGSVTNSLATGTVTAPAGLAGGLVGVAQNGATLAASFWNTTTSGNASGVGTGSQAGVTGLTTAQTTSLSTFANAGWDIDDAAGTGKVWRIYGGHTGPLLRSFMTGLTVTGGAGTKVYDGTTASSDVGTLSYGPSYDAALILGTAGYTSTSANVGSYGGFNLQLGGLYSSQRGYDLTLASGTLAIGQRSITVAADAQARSYGDANPALTYTVGGAGLVGGDGLSGALATSASATSGVGTYGIIQGTLAANANYAMTFTGGNLSVSARAITVTADALSRAYGDANPSLTYTVGGGGLANGDSLSGGLATNASMTSGVGTYGIIQGTLAANANYAMTFTGGNLSVTARGITVTADALSRTYGEANPTLTYTIGGGGLVNGDALSGAITTGAVVTSGAGAYGITRGSLAADANYDMTYVGANLTVMPRFLTVTADANSRIYGDANPLLTYTVGGTGLVNGDSLSGALGGAAATAGVGVHGVTQGTLANANYAIAYTGAGLTITPRSITVAADAQSRSYGDSNASLTYKVGGMGLVNGDNLSGALGGSTAATGIGTYGITQGTLASANYAITTYTGANLTITPRAITVTADALGRYYGEANPLLTYKVGGMGLVNGDMLAGVLATDATATSVAGSYQITQGTLVANPNYALTYLAGTLTVTDPPQIMAVFETTASDQSGEAQSAQDVMRQLNQPAQTTSTSEAKCETDQTCPLMPVPSNRPTSQWLSFRSP